MQAHDFNRRTADPLCETTDRRGPSSSVLGHRYNPDGEPYPIVPRRRILIIEDHRDSAESLGRLLGLLGHEVRVAYSGPDGVRAACEWLPELVLCDIDLPGLDGYDVARELRRNPATAGIRLVAVTAYGSDEDRRRSRQAGFDRHYTKPLEVATLPRLLGRPEPPVTRH